MLTELKGLVESVRPVIAGHTPNTPAEQRWQSVWLQAADKALATKVTDVPEAQLLLEVWAEYRYATAKGYTADGIDTLCRVQAYLTARGLLDGEGNIKGVDSIPMPEKLREHI